MSKIGILVKQGKIYYLYNYLIFSSLHFFYLLLFSEVRFPYRLPKKIPINHKDLWEFLFYTGKKFAFLKTYLYLCNISIIV